MSSTDKLTKIMNLLNDQDYVLVDTKPTEGSLCKVATATKPPDRENKSELSIQSVSSPNKSSTLQTLKGMKSLLASHGLGQHYKTKIKIASTIASAGLASVFGYTTMDPSGFSDWTSFAALFDEFRILRGVIHYRTVWNCSTSDQGLMAVAFDNDSASIPSTFDGIVQYGTSKTFPVQMAGRTTSYEFKRPNITPSAYWTDVASPSGSLGSVQYATVDSTTTNGRGILYQVVEYEIEFRSRR